MYNLNINYHPKPITDGDWNGSGCHTNFSTQPMRDSNGYSVILDAIDKLGKKHDYHMSQYGSDNNLRMTGLHETASFDKFSYGVANRGASIRMRQSIKKQSQELALLEIKLACTGSNGNAMRIPLKLRNRISGLILL